MKKRFATLTLSASLLVLPLAHVSSAWAAQATVIKVKGRQAIVQFPNDYTPAAGEKIEVGPAESPSAAGEEVAGSAGRAHTIGVSANLQILSNSNSGNTSSLTNIDLSGRYGWNFEIIEVGPILAVSYKSQSGSSSTSYQGGGFIDYDLLPNRPGVKLVAGLGAQGTVGQSSPSNGSSTSLIEVAGGGQIKWFCLGRQTAVRGDLLADYARQSNAITSTQTGLVVKLGVQTYF